MPNPFRPAQGDVLSTKVRRLVSVADRYLIETSDYFLHLQQEKPTTTKPNEAKKGFAQEARGLLEELLGQNGMPGNIWLAVNEFQTFFGYSTSERCEWEKYTTFELVADKYHEIRGRLLDSVGIKQEKKPHIQREADKPEEGGGIGTLEK